MATLWLDYDEAFAVYRLPNQDDYYLVRGNILDDVSTKAGFVMQHFDKSNDSLRYLVSEEVMVNPTFVFDTTEVCDLKSTTYDDYHTCAAETIAALREERMEKVVISRIKRVPRQGSQDICSLFKDLTKAYPSAFVFMYHIPAEGLWCGATPEVLITIGHHNQAQTMALAGTQADHGIALEDVEWGSKEVKEQNIIEQYVASRLDHQGISYDKYGPHTVQAGQVLHICTTYTMQDIEDPMFVANTLHPGPAICGQPQKTAMKWILDHELHNRGHYCGYLGPWGAHDNMVSCDKGDHQLSRALYINLRSMRIYKDAYILYLGGGLTKDSEPEAEWHETEMKSQTMLSVIHKNCLT